MSHRHGWAILTLTFCLSVFGADVRSQPSERPRHGNLVRSGRPEAAAPRDGATDSHVDIPLENQSLKDLELRWQGMNNSEAVQKLYQRYLDNPFLLNDEKTRKALQEMLSRGHAKFGEDDPTMRHLSDMLRSVRNDKNFQRLPDPAKQEVQKLLEMFQRLKDSKAPPDATEDSEPKLPIPQNTNAPGTPPPNPAEGDSADETKARFTRWMLEQAEQWQDLDKNGHLDNSPALQQAAREFSRYTSEIARNQSHLGETAGNTLKAPSSFTSSLMKRLGTNFRMPKLPKISLPPLPKTSLPSLGFSWGSMPSFSGSPNVPSSPGTGMDTRTALSGVALAFLLGLVIWKALQHSNYLARKRRIATLRRLGPWPVPPGAVSTKLELVQAYEYLSLLNLGEAVRSWHHRMIAASLGGADKERQEAALSLAAAYEQARYAPGIDALSAEDLQKARRSLVFLAKASAQ